MVYTTSIVIPLNYIDLLKPQEILLISIIYSALIFTMALIAYKTLPKNYFRISLGKSIAIAILFFLSIFFQLSYLKHIGGVLEIIDFLVRTSVWLVAIHFLISAVLAIIQKFKNKELTKSKKELIALIFIILLFNGSTLRIVYLSLLPIANMALSQSVYVCGLATFDFPQASPAREAGMGRDEKLISINNDTISGFTDFDRIMQSTVPGQELSVVTDKKTYLIKLAQSPKNPSNGFAGIVPMEIYCRK